MAPLDESTLISKVDLRDSHIQRWIAELLPRAARATCSDDGTIPAELLESVGDGLEEGTIADLVLDLSIAMTDGQLVREVTVDTSAVELVPAAFGDEPPDHLRWARLTIDLSRPDWTVKVSHQALKENEEPPSTAAGVIRILIDSGLDLRSWLAEEQTQEMLHEWYLLYQVDGALYSERQLAELHQGLRWAEERGYFVFASQLVPPRLDEATWQLQEIRAAGGAEQWALQLWERRDRPAILAAGGSYEREDVVGELASGAERLLVLAAEH
jgi:hypothetical protein